MIGTARLCIPTNASRLLGRLFCCHKFFPFSTGVKIKPKPN